MKRALILGYGNSGQAAAQLLKEEGYEVYILDDKDMEIIDYKMISYQKLRSELPIFNLIVRSPGIKATSAIYQLAQMLTIDLISEIELGYRYLKTHDVKIIAVTGTNGKTTLVTLLEALLKSFDADVHALGNIGMPLCAQIKSIKNGAILILEVSSFQLEDIKTFHPHIAVFTNIAPNHLDHVISYAFYRASKSRLLMNMDQKDHVFYNNESIDLIKDNLELNYINIDEDVLDIQRGDDGFYLKKSLLIKNSDINLRGKHNLNHVLVALNICHMLNFQLDSCAEVLKKFHGVNFRMEPIGKKGNFHVINDGKSTTVAATQAALEAFTDLPRVIILGGISKSGSFDKLKIRPDDIVYLYGQDETLIRRELKTGECLHKLEKIIEKIKKRQKEEKYLIFSPGCASFDQFKNYIERSQFFNRLVEDLNHVPK